MVLIKTSRNMALLKEVDVNTRRNPVYSWVYSLRSDYLDPQVSPLRRRDPSSWRPHRNVIPRGVSDRFLLACIYNWKPGPGAGTGYKRSKQWVKLMNLVVKTRSFLSEMMNFTLEMMDFALEMLMFCRWTTLAEKLLVLVRMRSSWGELHSSNSAFLSCIYMPAIDRSLSNDCRWPSQHIRDAAGVAVSCDFYWFSVDFQLIFNWFSTALGLFWRTVENPLPP